MSGAEREATHSVQATRQGRQEAHVHAAEARQSDGGNQQYGWREWCTRAGRASWRTATTTKQWTRRAFTRWCTVSGIPGQPRVKAFFVSWGGLTKVVITFPSMWTFFFFSCGEFTRGIIYLSFYLLFTLSWAFWALAYIFIPGFLFSWIWDRDWVICLGGWMVSIHYYFGCYLFYFCIVCVALLSLCLAF